MKGKLSFQRRLILPILLLGIVALISNALAVFSINNVNANAANIVDNSMVAAKNLEEIRRSVMNTHKMALSHIVATDYGTMIEVVTQIKQEEAQLDSMLEEYGAAFVTEEQTDYNQLLENYDSFKHTLVRLVCVSADGKTQEAYALANGEVASYSNAVEQNINALASNINEQTESARQQLMTVYITSIIISSAAILLVLLLVLAAIKIVKQSVIAPMDSIRHTLKGSSRSLSEVVNEVIRKTKTSNKSARDMSFLAENLSASIEEVASNTSVINDSVTDVKSDVNDMADECDTITEYSVTMKTRANELERLAHENIEAIRIKTSEMLEVLNEAVKQSRSVDQISLLTKDILNISSQTNLIAINASIEAYRAGKSGTGFAVVAREIRQLADACGETANHIQQVNEVVTGAVYHLSEHVQMLMNYINDSILTEFQQFVDSGKQYKDDATYIEEIMDKFNSRSTRLRNSMVEIAASINSISKAIDDGADGVTGVAGSARVLVDNMTDIAECIDVNRNISEQLKEQTEMLANL